MSDTSRKAAPGEPLNIAAATWNNVLDATADFLKRKGGRQGGGPLGRSFPGLIQVAVRNDTGGDLERGHILSPTDSIVDEVEQPEDVQRLPVFAGDAPSATSDPVLVLLEPIAADGIGRAAVGGVAVCTVSVSSGAHKWARPTAGNTTRLESADSGPCRILDREAGSTGDKIAVVALNNGGLPGGTGAGGTLQVYLATIKTVLTAGTAECTRADGSGADVVGTCHRTTDDWTLAVNQVVWVFPRQTSSATTLGTTWFMAPARGANYSADGTTTRYPGLVDGEAQAWQGTKTFWDQINAPAGIAGTLDATEAVTEQDFGYELTPAKLRLESADGRAVVAEVPDEEDGPVELSLIVPGSADDGAGDLRLTAGDAAAVLSGGTSVGNATDVSRVGTTFHEGVAFVAGFSPSDGTSGLPEAPMVYFGQQAVAWNSTLYVCRSDGLSGAALEGQSFDKFKTTLNGVDALRNVYRRGWLVSAASCPGPTTSPADGETLVWSSGGWIYGAPDPGEIATLDGGSF